MIVRKGSIDIPTLTTVLNDLRGVVGPPRFVQLTLLMNPSTAVDGDWDRAQVELISLLETYALENEVIEVRGRKLKQDMPHIRIYHLWMVGGVSDGRCGANYVSSD
jgi:hypothetical protein